MRLLRPALLGLIICTFVFSAASPVEAADQNFITPVFPVRGRQYWRQSKDISELTQLAGLVTSAKLPSTWLLHYDALFDSEVTSHLPTQRAQYGLFLEVTRKLAEDSFVKYDWEHGNWSQANKVFLSGYTRSQRQRMIDTAFTAFKNKFGYYPLAYGAWYVDVWSMEYIRDHYGANITLGLADQYSTDGYQTWGQYFDLPYFVSIESAIEPAESQAGSTSVLKLQWAPRHPLLGYGATVDFSNYSLQVNDYHRQKSLGQTYFNSLIRDLTVNVQGVVSQATIGIEAGEIQPEYFSELKKQFDSINALAASGQVKLVTMSQFNQSYRYYSQYVSPPAVISATDGRDKLSWHLSPQMRYGILDSGGKKYLVDLRYYHTSPYRDNDQLYPDYHPDLVRVAPAVIDNVVTGNAQEINADSDVGDYFSAPIPQPSYPPDLYGEYTGKWSDAKDFLVKLSRYIPDLVYSSLDGQKYFGLRISPEELIGIRFPGLKFGTFTFKFPVLSSFISLKSRLAPDFPWQGKQEIELSPHRKSGLVWEKGWTPGSTGLLHHPDGNVVYENSYYQVIKDE